MDMGAEWRQLEEQEEQQIFEEKGWPVEQRTALNSAHLKWKRKLNMPNINEMMPSKYLKKEDFQAPKVVTIAELRQENVAMDNQPPEMKWVCMFHETNKPLVLNSTNLQLIAKSLRSENTDDWINKQITLFNDPNVSFAGQLTGGIRVQIPIQQAQQFTQSENPGAGMDNPFNN